MITVSDPNGTPIPIYNRDGVTIQTITGSGDSSMGATQVVAPSGYSVVIVITSDTPDRAFILPTTAEIGDVVECYPDPATYDSGHLPLAFPPSGETFRGGAQSSIQIAQFGGFFRKIAATDWLYFLGGG